MTWLADLPAFPLDLYRDVHKGLRAEMFAVTAGLAAADPRDERQVAAATGRLHALMELFEDHASHEDEFLGPLITRAAPHLGAQVRITHLQLDDIHRQLATLSAALRRAGTPARRQALHRLHLASTSYTGVQLTHLAIEELEVMPALDAVVPLEDLAAASGALLASIPPSTMDVYLRLIAAGANPVDQEELAAAMAA